MFILLIINQFCRGVSNHIFQFKTKKIMIIVCDESNNQNRHIYMCLGNFEFDKVVYIIYRNFGFKLNSNYKVRGVQSMI